MSLQTALSQRFEAGILQGKRASGAVFLQYQTMEPRSSPDCEAQGELLMEKTRLANLLNDRHPLVMLVQQIDWRSFDEYFGAYYSGGKGRPATSTRL